MTQWDAGLSGVIELPSGRRLRGRPARTPGVPPADLTIHLSASPPAAGSRMVWVRWRDFSLPSDRTGAAEALETAWTRSAVERVEITCRGGRGRTGTALACVAVLDGLGPSDALDLVRRQYDPRAAETFWQRRYVSTFRPPVDLP